ISSKPASDWELTDGVDLSIFKDTVFYLAFTYACQTDGAYRLYYDDIRIRQENTGIVGRYAKTIGAKVLGSVSHQRLHLQIIADENMALKVYAYDLQGRVLAANPLKIEKGRTDYFMTLPPLSAGMYFLKLEGGGDALFLR